jgi:RNA polymerase sigma-70 factor (ECF subfamily)
LPDWDAIVRAHGPMAYETAWRVLGNVADADDAAQAAFLDAVRLDRDAGGRAIENWGGLLRRLVTCRALDLLRARRPAPVLSESTVAAGPSSRPDAVAEAGELSARLRTALGELPAREAEVFSLRYLADLSNTQIAAELGISTGAVGVALHKARARLEELLADVNTKEWS